MKTREYIESTYPVPYIQFIDKPTYGEVIGESEKERIGKMLDKKIISMCEVCNLPVYEGDAYYSIRMTHWDCHKNKVESSSFDMDKAITRLLGKQRKPSVTLGTGKTAKKLIHLLAVAFTEHLNEPIEDTDIWLRCQAPVYRNPRWDCCSWYGTLTRPLEPKLPIHLYGYRTMTQIVKAGKLTLIEDELLQYEIY